jgi:hypothetical protein
MPTSNYSAITIGGPCKLTIGGVPIYSEGNVTITPKPVYRDLPASLTSKDDQVLVSLTYEIDFTPKSIWTSTWRGVLLPSALTNFAVGGAALIGANNPSLVVLGADGEQWTFTRAALTKMPTVFCGLGKSVYGPATFTAFLGSGNALTDAAAFVAVATGQTWSQSDFPTGHQEAEATAAWGSVTGFTSIFGQEGFELSHDLELADVKQGNILVDKRIVGYRGMIAAKPEGPTTAQIAAQFPGVIGSRLSANAADFVVTASGMSMTLKSAMPNKMKYNFDLKLLRHDELAFVTALNTPGTRLVFS